MRRRCGAKGIAFDTLPKSAITNDVIYFSANPPMSDLWDESAQIGYGVFCKLARSFTGEPSASFHLLFTAEKFSRMYQRDFENLRKCDSVFSAKVVKIGSEKYIQTAAIVLQPPGMNSGDWRSLQFPIQKSLLSSFHLKIPSSRQYLCLLFFHGCE